MVKKKIIKTLHYTVQTVIVIVLIILNYYFATKVQQVGLGVALIQPHSKIEKTIV